MAARTAIRTACAIAALVAACVGGCQSAPREEKAPEAAAAPAAAVPEAPAAAPAAAPQPSSAAAEAPPKRKAPARKRAPKPKPPAPKVAKPAPPPVIVPPAPSPEQERARRLDEYLAAMRRTALAFNPPSPMQVERHFVVTLAAEPPKEAAQLAEELRKSLSAPESWRPRLRAQIAGADFDIAPAEGSDPSGAKDLPPGGRSEWSVVVAPRHPGTKQLTARVAILLPPALSEPRELPALQREVRVEPTLAWTLGSLWSDYWAWILGALVLVVAALAWWARRRFARER